jgi:23S rRNA-/tRNA-specific pseudouridylate synthase
MWRKLRRSTGFGKARYCSHRVRGVTAFIMIQIVSETEQMIAVEKPAGWLTTPARSMDDPRPVLGRQLQEQLDRQIYPVHRLDFEVSGLTLWAKTPLAHTRAQKWFEHGSIQKTYQALSRPARPPLPKEWCAVGV